MFTFFWWYERSVNVYLVLKLFIIWRFETILICKYLIFIKTNKLCLRFASIRYTIFRVKLIYLYMYPQNVIQVRVRIPVIYAFRGCFSKELRGAPPWSGGSFICNISGAIFLFQLPKPLAQDSLLVDLITSTLFFITFI